MKKSDIIALVVAVILVAIFVAYCIAVIVNKAFWQLPIIAGIVLLVKSGMNPQTERENK